ncbi:MAG: Fe-S protein assembly co-chaperone HscB [Holosporaceae bacterium]|jgi:molecular chaperone HscB|nr:Fe-S protein assembly co-chaperone HscB [Holosporaceae bacterium]
MNFFEIFGLPVRYKIDETALLKAYLQEQSCAHPDAVGSESEKSSYLNVAYKTLRYPIERARYFLELCGKSTDVLDPEFAVEMFSIREKYEILSDRKEKDKLNDELIERIAQLTTVLDDLENDIDAFQKNYCLLRFISSFLETQKNL